MSANRKKSEQVHGRTRELIEPAGQGSPPGDHTGPDPLEAILDELELYRIRLKLSYVPAQMDGKSSSNLPQ